MSPRILVLGTAAESSWGDEQSDFLCDTQQPGCTNVCYDRAFPIAHIRYWVLQIVFVSTPSLIYMGHAMHTVRREEKRRRKEQEERRQDGEDTEGEKEYLQQKEQSSEVPGRIRLRGALLQTYILSILIRTVMEVTFIVIQYMIYGVFLRALYHCKAWPCPNPVNCYMSRPTEKNVFIVFMLVVAGVSLLLSVIELYHLGWRRARKCLRNRALQKSAINNAVAIPDATEHTSAPCASALSCTPPPDFSECLTSPQAMSPMASSMTSHPFNQRMAQQQNSANMATERHHSLDHLEHHHENVEVEGRFLRMSYDQVPTSCSPPPALSQAGYVKDKRRLSKTSGTSSWVRPDDLAI
ncbi:gap junction protein, alpha 5a isoform X2 [Hypomesus transpacificus]|uniref:gap junction protein, alpha 5a isoform X2 n=1 Tax=Hypomesus transpacificus TaxID=137520 RepID=UPI001F07475C|nr:gap junction protein, alpha 5a isoform X2 [Hypomesus transpacificus]